MTTNNTAADTASKLFSAIGAVLALMLFNGNATQRTFLLLQVYLYILFTWLQSLGRHCPPHFFIKNRGRYYCNHPLVTLITFRWFLFSGRCGHRPLRPCYSSYFIKSNDLRSRKSTFPHCSLLTPRRSKRRSSSPSSFGSSHPSSPAPALCFCVLRRLRRILLAACGRMVSTIFPVKDIMRSE